MGDTITIELAPAELWALGDALFDSGNPEPWSIYAKGTTADLRDLTTRERYEAVRDTMRRKVMGRLLAETAHIIAKQFGLDGATVVID